MEKGLAPTLVGIYNGFAAILKLLCIFDASMCFLYIFAIYKCTLFVKMKNFLQNLQKVSRYFGGLTEKVYFCIL